MFDETDARAAGVMGPFGWPSANEVVGGADVVLAVGTKLGPHDTADETTDLLDPSRQTLIQIDIEPLNAAGRTRPTTSSSATPASSLARLADAVGAGRPAGERRPTGPPRPSVATTSSAHRSSPATTLPLLPQRVISVLHEAFPDDATVSCDAGENRLFMMHWYRSKSPGRYLQPAAGGGMGYAVPAAMAAKLALPDRPSLAVCGDGGFAMSIHALMTAVQEDIPIGVLVLNNGALGWVLHGMGEKAVAAGFDPFDHAADRPLARLRRGAGRDGERPARRHQGVPRRDEAVRDRRADLAGDVVPRRHAGHRPATPRDGVLTRVRRSDRGRRGTRSGPRARPAGPAGGSGTR